MAPQVPKSLALIRRRHVERRTGLSRTSIYRLISEGQFPKPVSLGIRAVGWVESEIDAWLAARVADSRGAPK